MKKKIFIYLLPVVFLLVCCMQKAVSSSFVLAPSAEGETIAAYLFLSDSCPWCRKLKESGFVAQFKKKYAGEVVLKEYEVHTPAGRQQFARLTKKHGLSGGVPVLIIGNTVVPGYSDNMMFRADEAVQKERKAPRPVKKKAKQNTEEAPALIHIAMEDEALQGVAPARELAQIKKYLEQVHDDNGETLSSINDIFNTSVSEQALAITTQAEQKLKTLATKSASFAAFKKAAEPVLAAQQKQLNDLMSKNTKALR